MGRRLERFYPKVPLVLNTALGIAIMSYDGQRLLRAARRLRRAGRHRRACAADLDAAIIELARAAALGPPARRGRRDAGPRVKRVLIVAGTVIVALAACVGLITRARPRAIPAR